MAKLFNEHDGGVLEFTTTMCLMDVHCPNEVGTHELAEHYASLAGSPSQLTDGSVV